MSVVAMGLIAGAVMWLFTGALFRQANADAVRDAEAVSKIAVERQFSGNLDTWSDSPDAFAKLNLTGNFDSIVAMGGSKWLDALTIYNTSGVTLYSSNGSPESAEPIWRKPAPEQVALRSAVSGHTSSVLERRPAGDVMSVYVPISYENAGPRVFGVAEVDVPYTATQQRVQRTVLLVGLIVIGVTLLGWLLLFRVVHQASLRLRAQAEENERLALHDPLTGLPNRRLLSDRLDRAVSAGQRNQERVALMFLDVDRFKEVNDTLGHDRGDELLRQVAQRLSALVRDADTVSRLGGDEFAVLAPNVGTTDDAERLARRLRSAFDKPFVVDDLVLHVESSLGVAVVPDHAADAVQVMQRADVAMYAAKVAHLGVLVYDPTEDGSSAERLLLLGDLRNAIGTDQLSMHYQPKVDLADGRPIGMEALLRWNHPERGNIPPNDFIPLAERTGLIHSLTRYVLEMVVDQMSEWDHFAPDFAHLPVAVNLSSRNLLEPSFADFVEDLLAGFAIDASRLELEVTESALIEDPVRTHAMLDALAALGVTIAVDDFGTGYTSMAQLEKMPLRTLKIDRSFIVRMMNDSGGFTLVKAIIELAHEFGLQVVAEGVEEADVTHHLRALGCDAGQGYLWSRPVPAGNLPDVLAALDGRSVDEGAAVPS